MTQISRDVGAARTAPSGERVPFEPAESGRASGYGG